MRKQTLEDMPRILAERAEPGAGWCMNWTGYKTDQGYGRMRLSGIWGPVHRFVYEAFRGTIPEGMLVRHTCDNPSCCNPDHLLLGTNDQNMVDKTARDRSGKKLNKQKALEVLAMKAAGHSQTYIASIMGVNQSNISRLVNGHRWAHVQSVSV